VTAFSEHVAGDATVVSSGSAVVRQNGDTMIENERYGSSAEGVGGRFTSTRPALDSNVLSAVRVSSRLPWL
jgi:hypothetical protein